MSRTRRAKPTLKVHANPPAEERMADPPTAALEAMSALPGATVAAEAAQAIVDEKLTQAKAPKPRRVGPLRKIHLAAFDRNAQLVQPYLDEIKRLEGEIRSLRAKVSQCTIATFDEVLEDLGDKRGDQDAWIVEEDGQSYVALGRAPMRPAGASQGPPAKA